MAGFKENGQGLAPTTPAGVEYRCLFNENSVVEETTGLVVGGDGQIGEIRTERWAPNSHPYERFVALILQKSGSEIVLSPSNYDPAAPTLGSESERIAMLKTDGEQPAWYNVLPDGRDIHLPDGRTLSNHELPLEFHPEMLKSMVEYGSDVAYGYKDFRQKFIDRTYQAESFFEAHNILLPPVSVVPTSYTREDLSDHPYVSHIARQEMPNILEFGCMSEQLHVQKRTAESGLYALNTYQPVQALFGLLTASSPLRDGKFDTTLAEHYAAVNGDAPSPMPQDDYLLDRYGDKSPSDWREFSHLLGSPDGGAWREAAPLTLSEFLAKGDSKLKSGETVSASRTLGWHGDRYRLEQDTLEICNLGNAGGNLHKLLATQETVAKFLVALEQYYCDETADEREALYGLLAKPTDKAQAREARQAQVEAGHINNIFTALEGKDQRFVMPGYDKTVTAAELLNQIVQFTNKYSPVKVTDEAKHELNATLQSAPSADEYAGKTASHVLDDFYQPNSRMTAGEALRLAHQVEPGLPTAGLLELLAAKYRQHVFEMYATSDVPTEQTA